MRTTIENPGVNAGTAPAEALVEVTFSLPAAAWDALKEESVKELLTTDEIVALALQERYATTKAVENFEGRTGLSVEELFPLIQKAGVQAVFDYTRRCEELTVPVKMAVVPSGHAPLWVPSLVAERLFAAERAAGFDDLFCGHHLAQELMGNMVSERDMSELGYHLSGMPNGPRPEASAAEIESDVDAVVASWQNGEPAPAASEDDGDLVSLMVPRWMRRRLEETIAAGEIEGGIVKFVTAEFGDLLSDSSDTFHEGILINWDYKEEERQRAEEALSKLRESWEREDGEEPEPEAAASVEGGEA